MGKRLTAFRSPTKSLLATSKISITTLLLFSRIVKYQLECCSNLSGTLFHLSWKNIPSNMEQPSSLVITLRLFIKLSFRADFMHDNVYSSPPLWFIYDVARGMQMHREGITLLPCKPRHIPINRRIRDKIRCLLSKI